MPTPTRSASSLEDTLKARKVHLAGLLALLDMKNKKATKIETLSTDVIKHMISALNGQLKKKLIHANKASSTH